jgi:hypothetical protein
MQRGINSLTFDRIRGNGEDWTAKSMTGKSVFYKYRLCLLLFSLAAGAACGDRPQNKINASDLKFPQGAEKFAMGEKVYVRATAATQAAGVAGRSGNMAGFTMPSHTQVEVIGEVNQDLAFSVIFRNPDAQLWLAPDLLEDSRDLGTARQ